MSSPQDHTDDQLPAHRRLAVAVLAAGGTYQEAGETSGVTSRTIARWMTGPEFRRAVSDARLERVSQVTGQLADLSVTAVDVLRDGLDSEKTADRLRAAQLILAWSARMHRDTDLEQRVLEIERLQGIRTDSTDDGPPEPAQPQVLHPDGDGPLAAGNGDDRS